jgi:hypothetical protein
MRPISSKLLINLLKYADQIDHLVPLVGAAGGRTKMSAAAERSIPVD